LISQWANNANYLTIATLPAYPIVPTNVSAFTNDAGYITANSTNALTNKSGNISQWANNAGYLTLATLPAYPTVPTNNSAFNNDSGYITASSSNALTNKSGAISQWTNDANYTAKNVSNLWTANQEIRLTTEQLRLSYDAANFAAFTISSGGVLTISQSSSGGAMILAQGIATATTTTSANLCILSGAGSGASGTFGFGGSAASNVRVNLKGTTSTITAASNNYANLLVGSSPFTKAASGTSDIAANVAIRPIGTITAGAATLNNTVSLYVEAATTGGAVGNYAMWVDAGKCRFDEVIQLQSYTNSTPADTDFWFDGTNLKFRIGGVTKTITWT
jgi:hypothetical protein